ncbi:ferritin-like domain-containing protein [Sphingomonas sp. 1185]|uniref:ferritin-like domain-containing protein n=1 Tax=Sphingomonas sp. 1185 TaxID=3156411 RepID=UPI0033934E4B
MATLPNDVVAAVFVAGLKNAHAVEHQALALIDRQLDHLSNYPDVADRLRMHRGETEQQIVRLEEILDGFNESRSVLKDAALSFSGNMAALGHTFAPDEILKNSFANFAFENFEAASYKSLLTIADAGGFDSAALLTQSLNEELAMAAWVDDNNAALTRRYLERRAAGDTASH